MGQYPFNQSSFSRAWTDTRSSHHKILFFWVVEVIAAGLGVFVGTIVTPEDAGRIISAVYPMIGGLIGILAGFAIIFIINLICAPYRQRNEARSLLRIKPKPILLRNREELLRTIAEIKKAAVEVAENVEDLGKCEKGNVVFINPERWGQLDSIRKRFKYACESLDREILVAGSICSPILKPLYSYMQSSVKLNPPDVDGYKAKLDAMVEDTRNRIDELSQLDSDRADSQTE